MWRRRKHRPQHIVVHSAGAGLEQGGIPLAMSRNQNLNRRKLRKRSGKKPGVRAGGITTECTDYADGRARAQRGQPQPELDLTQRAQRGETKARPPTTDNNDCTDSRGCGRPSGIETTTQTMGDPCCALVSSSIGKPKFTVRNRFLPLLIVTHGHPLPFALLG